MFTLEKLASSHGAYSLEDWIHYACGLGLQVKPDAPLNDSAVETLFLNIKNFEPIAAKGAASSKPAETPFPVDAPEIGNTSDFMSVMESFIEKNVVLLDPMSFLSEEPSCHKPPPLDKPLEVLFTLLQKCGKNLNITPSARNRLMEGAEDKANPERRALYVDFIKKLSIFVEADKLKLQKTVTNQDPMQDMVTLCGYHRINTNLLVITQDEKMAANLMMLNKQESVKTPYRILAKRFDVDANGNFVFINTIEKVIPPEPFRICKEVREKRDEVLPTTETPTVGDEVYADETLTGEAIRLGDLLGEGGEGSVYKTNLSSVAKIYKPSCCTAYRKEKIDLLSAAKDKSGKKLAFPGICFPESPLYNRKGEFVGYLMPEAKGRPLARILKKKQLTKLGWKRIDLAICANQILTMLDFLHDYNILMGDINPKNFLVVSPTEVYIVDTDSFQINDLPSPVAFPEYLAPEIHQARRDGEFKTLSEIMRTKESERFAVATLLFTILLPGKHPYSQQDGLENEVENILNMHFPYALGSKHGQRVPMGPWRYMWSHLSRDVKEGFHRVFQGRETKEADKESGKRSDYNIAKRLSLRDWRMKMGDYTRTLDDWNRKLEENPDKTPEELGVDAESLELYPKRLRRKDPRAKYLSCVGGCGREIALNDPEAAKKIKNGVFLCLSCKYTPWKQGICDYCGATFEMTYYEKYLYTKPPFLCPECRQKKNEVVKSGPCQNLRLGMCSSMGKKPGEITLLRAASHKHKRHDENYPLFCEDCQKKMRQKKMGG